MDVFFERNKTNTKSFSPSIVDSNIFLSEHLLIKKTNTRGDGVAEVVTGHGGHTLYSAQQ
jgi:hypothetical protein